MQGELEVFEGMVSGDFFWRIALLDNGCRAMVCGFRKKDNALDAREDARSFAKKLNIHLIRCLTNPNK